MKKCIIAISSVNHAIRGEKILTQNGLKVRIVKLQPETTKKGCAYGIELSCKDIPTALTFLEKSNLPYSEVVR